MKQVRQGGGSAEEAFLSVINELSMDEPQKPQPGTPTPARPSPPPAEADPRSVKRQRARRPIDTPRRRKSVLREYVEGDRRSLLLARSSDT